MGNRKKPPIVIQGLTDQHQQVIEHYKDYECVWVTWNTQPKEHLDQIDAQPNITLITLDPPELKYDEHFGMYVWVTTLKGFEYLKEKGYDFGIRVRSDFLVDIPQVLKLTKYDHFNCFGWDTGSVGYLCDYYFSGPVDKIIELMKACIDIDSESHAENIMTYAMLEVVKWRDINYTLTDETKFKWLKKGIDEQHYMEHVRNDTWYNTTDRLQISRFIRYEFEKDNFPDDYHLTYKTGPK
tara:strand:+ start:219 stop:935 length:717 start_codon:yes stop_codon:yes gene_type:complete